MGKITKPQKVKLFIAVIFKDESLFNNAKKYLLSKFGDADFESEILDFKYTNYYERELGVNLKRKFLSFPKLISPDKIARIKNLTNRIESKFSQNGKRRINLDPGYLNDAKIVLATTKDYSHRIYLKNGIFAEITLAFAGGNFKPLPWTYPDYQSKDYIDIFGKIRDIYMEQRKNV